jgi:hemolysin activation/secretion protein
LLQQIERGQRALILSPNDSDIAPQQAPDSSNEPDHAIRFTIRRIILRNISVFSEEILLELLSDTLEQSVSLAELKARTKRITDYYHAHGYPAAYAFLPEQVIGEDGNVEIQVLEGYLGEIHLNNTSRLKDVVVNKLLPKLMPGDILQQDPLERSTLLVNDIPGVLVQTAFNPGKDPGFTDVDITLTDRPILSAQFSADNQGNRYTGYSNRFIFHPEINNLTGYGEKLSANLLYGGFGMRYHQAQFQLPTYWTGQGRVGIEHSEVEYHLGREFAASGSQGTTRTNALYADYPLIRSDAKNLILGYRYQEKMIRDQVVSTGDNNQRGSFSHSYTANGDWRDSAFNLWSINYTQGRLDINSLQHRALDATSAKTLGYFNKINWSYARLQGILGSERTSIMLSLNGQLNLGRNLDTSEKMVLGGAHGVRAYPSSEGMSDKAVLVSLEVKYQLSAKAQVSVFYDYGNGIENTLPWPAVKNTNQAVIGGTGVGLRFQLGETGYLSLQSAWRTLQTKPTSTNDKSGGCYWLEMGRAF